MMMTELPLGPSLHGHWVEDDTRLTSSSMLKKSTSGPISMMMAELPLGLSGYGHGNEVDARPTYLLKKSTSGRSP